MQNKLSHSIYLNLLLFLSSFVLVACAHTPSVNFEGSYTLQSIDGEAYREARSVILRVEDNRLYGNGPVNNWSAALDGDKLGPAMSTMMAGPEPLMKAEARLYRALENSHLAKGEQGELLIVRDGQTVIVATPLGNGFE